MSLDFSSMNKVGFIMIFGPNFLIVGSVATHFSTSTSPHSSF